MGNGNIHSNYRLECAVSVIQACLGCSNLILDGGELAIHKEVGIPRGKLSSASLKYLSYNEVQLLHAAGSSNLSSLRWYISQGINPNTYDENRTSALHVSARQGSHQVISELTNRGASVNLTDVAGWSSLHIGAYYGRASVVSLLLAHNADCTLVNRRGETPWDLASNELTQKVFLKHCLENEVSERKTRPTLPVDLSTMEFTNLLQHRQPGTAEKSPILEESSHLMASGYWIHPSETPRSAMTLHFKPSARVKAECIKVFNVEPFRGLSVMIVLGVAPTDIVGLAEFFFTEHRLSKSAVGAVLGECESWYRDIAIEFMLFLDFKDKSIMDALKRVVGAIGLPSEGVQVNQILAAFGVAFSTQNRDFGSSESVQGLAFSILMLDRSIIAGKPTSKAGFLKENRGLKEGEDFPEEFLLQIYTETERKNVNNVASFDVPTSPFQRFDKNGAITIKGKTKKVGLLEEFLFFFPKNSNIPYALAVLTDCEVTEHWLTGTVSIKSRMGIPTAKFTRDGRVRTKKELVIQFKCEDIKSWVEALKAV